MAKRVTRVSSKNTQISLIPDLSEMVKFLVEEKYLFLPENWVDDKNLCALKYIAELKGYNIEYSHNAPIASTVLITKQIESSIYEVTGLSLPDYATPSRKQLHYYARVIYCVIARSYRLDRSIISEKINRRTDVIRECELKHYDLFRFHQEYRRIYNDCMTIITNTKTLENV